MTALGTLSDCSFERGGYKVNITGLGDSDAFDIKTSNPYPDLYKQAMGYFMYHRMGSATVNFSAQNTRGGTTSRSDSGSNQQFQFVP